MTRGSSRFVISGDAPAVHEVIRVVRFRAAPESQAALILADIAHADAEVDVAGAVADKYGTPVSRAAKLFPLRLNSQDRRLRAGGPLLPRRHRRCADRGWHLRPRNDRHQPVGDAAVEDRVRLRSDQPESQWAQRADSCLPYATSMDLLRLIEALRARAASQSGILSTI